VSARIAAKAIVMLRHPAAMTLPHDVVAPRRTIHAGNVAKNSFRPKTVENSPHFKGLAVN
jgi:hypothetical protein